MITSYNTSLPIDKPHADVAGIGNTTKPTAVRLKVTELNVVTIITNVSNYISIVGIVLYSFFFFFDLLLFSLNYVIISLILLIELLNCFNHLIFFPIFVQDQYFLVVHLGIIDHIFGQFI